MKRLIEIALFFSALAFYLAFNAYLPVTDPVESNYALTAKEMVLSGDLMSPRIYGQYWFDKPIMIYWLIALSYKVFGMNEFAARFPAALFSACSISFMYWFAQQLYHSKKVALFSVLILGSSLEYWILAKMIITDAVLFFFTSVSLAVMYLGMHNGSTKWRIVAYAAAALAVLTKGPVGLVLPGLIILCYIGFTRKWSLSKRLMLFRGLMVFLLVAAPWYGWMILQHGQQFVDTFLGLHNYLRATVSEHPEDNVFYYYLVLFPVSLLPWTGILLRSLLYTFKGLRTPHFAYLGIWAGVILVFYNLMATKYLTYVFPASFPAALWMGFHLKEMYDKPGRWKWLWLTVPLIVLLLIFALAGPLALHQNDGLLLLQFCAALSILLVIWLQVKGSVGRLPLVSALSVMLVSLNLISGVLIPTANSRSAKEIVKKIPAENAMVASYGDYSTSAVFYSGYNIPTLEQEARKDRQNVWSGKYTMPVELLDTFTARTQNNKEVYILVKRYQQNFEKVALSSQFQPIAAYSDLTLYKKRANN